MPDSDSNSTGASATPEGQESEVMDPEREGGPRARARKGPFAPELAEDLMNKARELDEESFKDVMESCSVPHPGGGLGINAYDQQGFSFLHKLTQLPDWATFLRVLEPASQIELDFNLQDKCGRSVLHLAIAAGSAADEALTALVNEFNVDLNKEDYSPLCKTPLYYAVENTNRKAYDLLMNNESRINFDIPSNAAARSLAKSLFVLANSISQEHEEVVEEELATETAEYMASPATQHRAILPDTLTVSRAGRHSYPLEGGEELDDMPLEEMHNTVRSRILRCTETDLQVLVLHGDVQRCSRFLDELQPQSKHHTICNGDSSGQTSLHMAAWKGHLDICRLLLEHLRDAHLSVNDRSKFIQASDCVGHTALHLAAFQGHKDICKFLIEEVAVDCRDVLLQYSSHSRQTALHLAAKNNRRETCAAIMAFAEQSKSLSKLIAARTDQERTVLHLGANVQHWGVCKTILNSLSVTEQTELILMGDEKGETAVHIAARSSKFSFWRKLIDFLPEDTLQAVCKQHRISLLDAAAYGGNCDIFQSVIDLLKLSISDLLEGENKNKQTVLHIAAGQAHLELFSWLIEQTPAEERIPLLRRPDFFGQTALQAAAQHEEVEIELFENVLEQVPSEDGQRLITRRNAMGQSTIFSAVGMSGDLELVQFLRKRISDEDFNDAMLTPSKKGKTCMHFAARKGFSEIVQWLLNSIPHTKTTTLIKHQDERGRTALHEAAQGGHKDVCTILLDHLPKDERHSLVTKVGKDRNSALSIAIKGGYSKVVEYLLAHVKSDSREELLVSGSSLQEAARLGSSKLCQDLLTSVPPEKRLKVLTGFNRSGQSVLHFAATRKNTNLCRELLACLPEKDREVALEMKNKQGKSVLDIPASRQDFIGFVTLFLDMNPSETAGLFRSSEQDPKRAQLVERLKNFD